MITNVLRKFYRRIIPLKIRLKLRTLRLRLFSKIVDTQHIQQEETITSSPEVLLAAFKPEEQIINFLKPILESKTLQNYQRIWKDAGFTVTTHYNSIPYETNPYQFAYTPLMEQVQNYSFNPDQSFIKNAEQIIELVRSLIDTKRYLEFFNIWADAGFHITPFPPPMPPEGFLPNVFLLGAAKSGTTTLHAYMSLMNSVCTSHPKEPFFFEVEYELGLAHYQRLYFAHWRGEPIIGDARQRNLCFQHVPERIYKTNPNAKLVVILRNPIDRAYSHWWQRYSRGYEFKDFEDAIMEDHERIKAGFHLTTSHEMEVYLATLDISGKGIYRTYLDAGYYYEQISRYLNYFPQNQLKIFFYEDLVERPYWLIRELENFIGVNHYNLENFLPIRENIAVEALPGKIRTPIYESLRRWLRDHYYQHNLELARYTGKDLSHWI